jgi:hypothetical protein
LSGRNAFPAAWLLLGLLPGCAALALSPYDAQAYQYLARMEAHHFQLIDDCTVDPQDKTARRPTAQAVQEECKTGGLVFREANAYVGGRGRPDALRTNAFDYLTAAYGNDCADFIDRAKTGDKFPTPKAAENLKQEHAENYGLAMRGEWARVKK